MSANSIISKQMDGLDVIRQLLTLDPKKVAADQEAIRNQIQLTDAEQGKIAEAKAWIPKFDGLSAELKGREDALVSAKEAHANEVIKFKTYSETETLRLNNLATDLGKAQIAVDAAHAAHAGNVAQLSRDRTELDRQHQEIINANNLVSTTNSQAKALNDSEAQRLREWEATLKNKAQKLREHAANF